MLWYMFKELPNDAWQDHMTVGDTRMWRVTVISYHIKNIKKSFIIPLIITSIEFFLLNVNSSQNSR